MYIYYSELVVKNLAGEDKNPFFMIMGESKMCDPTY